MNSTFKVEFLVKKEEILLLVLLHKAPWQPISTFKVEYLRR
jgi:hypothetical protein